MIRYLCYLIAQFLAIYLSKKWAYCVARIVSRLYYYFSWQSRQAVRNNMSHVVKGKLTKEEFCRLIWLTYLNFGKYLADFLFFPKIDANNIDKIVRIKNRHYIDEAFSYKRGVIALSAHLGNWEIGGIALSLKGYPINAIVLSHDNPRVNQFFIRQRKQKNMNIIPVGSAFRKALRVLRKGESIAVLGDRDIFKRGIKVDLFGKEAIVPKGPAMMAVETGAAVLPVFAIRQPDETYKLIFEKPFFAKSGKNRNESIQKTALQIAGIIEEYIGLYPEQWLLFHHMWEGE
ncbi:lysophospholipid acyltransferase family protein [bacterium]|nr:lysophospholipid acyltransferase family protein [bacterium]